MGLTMHSTRLTELLALRARVDAEIRAERACLKATAKRMRAARRRAEQERAKAEQAATDLQLARMAPASRVRAWAQAAGIPIGDRGRVSRELRLQYLEARRATAPLRKAAR